MKFEELFNIFKFKQIKAMKYPQVKHQAVMNLLPRAACPED